MSDVLQSLSDALAGAVSKTSSGIVRVDARRRLPATGIVWSSDGIIVTAHHIVERNENIQVGLEGDVITPARLIGRDPNTDLAVLKVEADTTPPVWASDDDQLQVGHLVLALGRPGSQVEATLGVVSKLAEGQVMGHRHGHHGPHGGSRGGRRRKMRHMEGEMFSGSIGPIVQTDVVMYPGFSGGPLVDAGGSVRGLNTSALAHGSSLTIPVVTVRKVVEALLSHGKVRRGYLGIGAQPVRLPAALAEELDQEIGLMLVSVEADSPAEKGGLLLGDILVALDDYSVQSVDELLMLLGTDRVGTAVTLNIVRGGQLVDVAVTIGERE
jgi:S1-C subfamily serine protease